MCQLSSARERCPVCGSSARGWLGRFRADEQVDGDLAVGHSGAGDEFGDREFGKSEGGAAAWSDVEPLIGKSKSRETPDLSATFIP